MVVASSGCGSDLDQGTAVAAPEWDIEDVETALTRALEQVHGTATSLADVSRREQVRFQDFIRHCMAESGFDYSPPPLTYAYQDWEVVPFPDEFPALAPLEDGTSPGSALAVDFLWEKSRQYSADIDSAPNPGFTELSPEDQVSYNDAADKCVVGAQEGEIAFEAIVDHDLLGELLSIMDKAEHAEQVASAMSQYPACLASFGFKASNRDELIAAVREAYVDVETAAELGADAAQAEAEAAAKALQADAVRADTDCRREAHSEALRAIAFDLYDFVDREASRLAKAEENWGPTR